MSAGPHSRQRWLEMSKREQVAFAVALCANFNPSCSVYSLANYVYERWVYANRAPDLSAAEIALLDELLGHEPVTTKVAA